MFGHNVTVWCMVNKREQNVMVVHSCCSLLIGVHRYHHVYHRLSRHHNAPHRPHITQQIDYHQVFLISDKTFCKWSVSWMRRTLFRHLPKSASGQMRRWKWILLLFFWWRGRGLVYTLRILQEINNRFWQNVCTPYNISLCIRTPAHQVGMLYIINFCYSSSTIYRGFSWWPDWFATIAVNKNVSDIVVACQLDIRTDLLVRAGWWRWKCIFTHTIAYNRLNVEFDTGRLVY